MPPSPMNTLLTQSAYNFDSNLESLCFLVNPP